MGRDLSGDRRYVFFVGLIALVSILLLAGCGGGSSSTSTGGSTGTEESSEAPPAAEEGKGEATSSEVVAAATKISDPFFEPPKSIGITEPLKEKAPAGKKVVVMACQLTVCEELAEWAVEAVEKLGWSAKVSLFSGAPEDNLNKISAAVSEHPDAIILDGVARETYEAAAEQAAKEGVPIVTTQAELEAELEPPYAANLLQGKQFDVMAEATANWFIADSEGKGNALAVAYAQFPLSERITSTTAETIEKDCPECSVKKILAQSEDTGTKLPGTIVSELQANPDIDYVILQDMAMFAGIEPAIREAGLEGKVKIMGNNTTPESIKAVEEGFLLGNMAFSQKAVAYQAVDATVRAVEGMSTKETEEAPLMNQIFTEENIPSTAEGVNELPTNLVEQYEKLWLLK